MKKHRSSQFLAICTAAVLALSVPAWASQVSITPLDTGNTTSSQSQSGASEPSTAQNTSGQTVDISSITKPTVVSPFLEKSTLPSAAFNKTAPWDATVGFVIEEMSTVCPEVFCAVEGSEAPD